MKIVAVDNFDRESRAERLVASNIENEEELQLMLLALQDTCSNDGPIWYRAFPNDYRLWRGMADLVGDDDELNAMIDAEIGVTSP